MSWKNPYGQYWLPKTQVVRHADGRKVVTRRTGTRDWTRTTTYPNGRRSVTTSRTELGPLGKVVWGGAGIVFAIVGPAMLLGAVSIPIYILMAIGLVMRIQQVRNRRDAGTQPRPGSQPTFSNPKRNGPAEITKMTVGTRPSLSTPTTRASSAEREAVAGFLEEQYLSGRLTLEEYEQRVELAFAALTLGDLSILLSDLPDVWDLVRKQEPSDGSKNEPPVTIPETAWKGSIMKTGSLTDDSQNRSVGPMDVRGPARRAIQSSITSGTRLTTPTRGAPFTVASVNDRGIVLLFGAKEAPTSFSWACLEGAVDFLRDKGFKPGKTCEHTGVLDDEQALEEVEDDRHIERTE